MIIDPGKGARNCPSLCPICASPLPRHPDRSYRARSGRSPTRLSSRSEWPASVDVSAAGHRRRGDLALGRADEGGRPDHGRGARHLARAHNGERRPQPRRARAPSSRWRYGTTSDCRACRSGRKRRRRAGCGTPSGPWRAHMSRSHSPPSRPTCIASTPAPEPLEFCERDKSSPTRHRSALRLSSARLSKVNRSRREEGTDADRGLRPYRGSVVGGARRS